MTTFQDPPPHSRRAVRQSERDGSSAPQAPTAPVEGTPYNFDATAGSTQSAPSAPLSGRRAQGRVAPPSDGVNSQPLSNQPPPSAFETPEEAAFRLRDFSPEGRRAAQPRQVPDAASPSTNFPPPARPVDLDYQTQMVNHSASHSAQAAPLDDNLNHTLTRRELREMRAAEEAKAPPLLAPIVGGLPEPIDTLLNSGPIDIPTLAPPPGQSQALAEAMAEFDLLTRARREAEARARDAQVASLATPIIPRAVEAPAPLESAPQAPEAQAPEAYAPEAQAPEAQAPDVQAPDAQAPDVQAPEAQAPFMDLLFGESAPQAPAQEFPFAPQPYPTSAPQAAAPDPISSAPIASAPIASAPIAPEHDMVALDFIEPDLTAPLVSGPDRSDLADANSANADLVDAEPVDDEVIIGEVIDGGVTDGSVVDSEVTGGETIDREAVDAERVDSAPVSAVSPHDEFQPSSPEPPVLAAPTFQTESVPQASVDPSGVSPVLFQQPTSAPTGEITEQDAHGGRSPRAAGHWRVQAAIEDNDLPFDNTLSRTVGSNTSAITTSALVLPSVPQPDGILHNLTATGEILVTGSIDLPRSLGSTGAHPNRIDNSDFEDDPLDSQIAAPDSAPVRAIRAISTNTSTRGIIEHKKPAGTRLLTSVIVIASVLCVGLVGLLVYAFATNKL